MNSVTIIEKVRSVLESKKQTLAARLFVSREDGITIYDSVQDNTTTAVAALVSGLWQASEALMEMVEKDHESLMFRMSFDTSSSGILLLPFGFLGKKYYLGAIYNDCVNPGLLKRQVSLIKEELEQACGQGAPLKRSFINNREGYLFQDITDEEMDRLFALGGV